MTDADLLRLLQEKLPGDFTPDELALLRVRCAESADVRTAVAEVLQLETDLATGLGMASLAVDELMARAQSRRKANRRVYPAWWGLLGLIVVLVAAIGVWSGRSPRDVREQVVQTDRPPAPNPEAAIPPDPRESVPEERPAAIADANPPQPTADAAVILPPTVATKDEPWAKWFDGTEPRLPLDSPQLRSDLRTMGHDELSLTEWRRWWTEAAGSRATCNQDVVGNRRTISFQGTMQLKAPLVDDAVLRFTPFDVEELCLLFWSGGRGVGLRFYRHREPHTWAAYEIQRTADDPTPIWKGLLTTDSGAIYRSGAVTLDVRRQDGQLLLAIGQIPLLAVPYPDRPETVHIGGRARLRGFSWLRSDPWPMPPPSNHPHVFGDASPAEWTWTTAEPQEAMLHAEADGRITLTGTSKSKLARAFVTLPAPQLVETVVRIAAADAGTGIYLGDHQGRPLAMLALSQDRRTKQLVFGPARGNERRVESDYDLNAFPSPYWTPQVWLKLVAGLGTLHVWCSADGEQWGHLTENPVRDVPGAVQSIGLYCVPGETPRTIRVETLRVRELSGVTRLADAGRRQQLQTEPWPSSRAIAAWEAEAVARCPSAIDAERWMTTFAVATLERGPDRGLARELIERLRHSQSFREVNADQRRQALDDLVVLLDNWHEQDAAAFQAAYLELDRETSLHAGWTAWLQSPIWSHPAMALGHWKQLLAELPYRAFVEQRNVPRQWAHEAQFWVNRAHPDHHLRTEAERVEWLSRWMRASSPGASAGADRTTDEILPLAWRHPLQLIVNKDAYNIQAELRSALVGGNYRDACRMAISFGSTDSVGLLPDAEDSGLFVSIPVMMASALEQYPEFGRLLRGEFEASGRMRVSEAAARGDVVALQAATIQFFGTAAASDALQLLGDRAMALGESYDAWRHYREAQRSVPANQRDALQARIALAEGLLALPPSTAETSAAAGLLAGQSVSALVNELRPQQSAAPAARFPTAEIVDALPPGRFKWETKARFDGQVGQNAGRGEFRTVDAFGRQFGVAVDDRRIYLSNRFQVTAYDRETGHQHWATAVGSEQGEAHGHRFAAMTPLVVGERLFVRRLTKAGVELACLNAGDGNVVWKTRSGEKSDVISEAVFLPHGVCALVSHRTDDEALEVRWTRFDAGTGAVLAEAPLVRLRDAWAGEAPCTLSLYDRQALAVIGGAVVGFDVTGEVQWLRRETWLPPKIDPQSDDYLVTPPQWIDNSGRLMAVIVQPSSRAVAALDAATGRQLWASVHPQLEGLVAVRPDIVVVAERDVLVGLSTHNGHRQWSQSLTNRLAGFAVHPPELIVAVERTAQPKNKGWPQLVWLDLATGEPHREGIIDGEAQPEWCFGPLFPVGDRWWALLGQGTGKPQRELAVLTPVAGSAIGPWEDPGLGTWLSPNPADRRVVHAVLPGWQPLVHGGQGKLSDVIRLEGTTLISRLQKPIDSLRFVQTVTLKPDGPTDLNLRVGHPAGQSWKLQVLVGGQIMLEEVVGDATAPTGELTRTVSLVGFVGRPVLVQVLQTLLNETAADAVWYELRFSGRKLP